MEIRPTIDWDKGRALQYLLDNLGFDSSSDALPIYIGDDKTDEDAFKVYTFRSNGSYSTSNIMSHESSRTIVS